MSKDELIAKQQLEIEGLKSSIVEYEDAHCEAINYLCKPEQWNTQCRDFPLVAMSGIVGALNILRS